MRRYILALCAISLSTSVLGQTTENQKLIELGRVYKDFMFRNEPTKEVLKEVKSDVPKNLKESTEFVLQAITTDNRLLSQKFLSRPDDTVLRQIFIIRAINLNLREENQASNDGLIDSLLNKEISAYELVDNYYGMLFNAVANKNQPFDLTKVNLSLRDYGLKNDTEEGIVVLRANSFCDATIWGYLNVAKPANTQKALALIYKFPKINGQAYFQYTDFYFDDFQLAIVKGKGLQSYKSYYLDKFYETLLSHLLCLNKENKPEPEKNDLMLGSILKERNLYKYTRYKETLEGLFKEQKD